MKIIFGLGNPEPEYSWTRHNVGKDVLNILVEMFGSSWEHDSKFDCDILKSSDFILVKPHSFMNEIGSVVAGFANYYKCGLDDVLVCYDELDLVIGAFKLGKGKGSNIHNGLLSVEEQLGSKDFWHLRVGVRDEFIPMSVQKAGKDPSKYVLAKFNISHRNKISKLVKETIAKELTAWLSKK